MLAQRGSQCLPFHSEFTQAFFDGDALHVVGQGLGVRELLLPILHGFARQNDAIGRKKIVFLLGTNISDEHYFTTHLGLMGTPSLPKFVWAEANIAQREAMYTSGGVLSMGHRNLIVDFLCRRIPPHLIQGFIVLRAERVGRDTPEAFVLRLFRECSSDGFIKAFSEHPSFIMENGANGLEDTLKALQLTRFRIWPRFEKSVIESCDRVAIEPIEVRVGNTKRMASIQSHLIAIIEESLLEVKARVEQQFPNTIEQDTYTTECVLSATFARRVKGKYRHIWLLLSRETKQLIDHLGELRQLNSDLYSLDCVTFLYHVEAMMQRAQRSAATWILSEHAPLLVKHTRERVYRMPKAATNEQEGQESLQLELEVPPKWEALCGLVEEVALFSQSSPLVLVVVNSDSTRRLVAQCVAHGASTVLRTLFHQYIEAGDQQRWGKDLLNVDDEKEEEGEGFDEPEDEFNPLSATNSAPDKPRSKAAEKKKKAETAAQVAKSDETTLHVLKLKRMTANGSTMAPPAAAKSALLNVYKKPTCQESLPAGRTVTSTEPLFEWDFASDERETRGSQKEERDRDVKKASRSKVMVHVITADGIHCISIMKPTHVIFFDISLPAIRTVEHWGNITTKDPLEKVFLLSHGDTSELQVYKSALAREAIAFEQLIKMRIESYGIEDFQTGLAVATHPLGLERPHSVIVDSREFRGPLASQLHAKGLAIIPKTLEIGDYILTPSICVERKSISDLVQSLASGRLWMQLEAMAKAYTHPVLLIEFTKQQAFSMRADLLGMENSSTSIQQKLVILAYHFPTVRILWCRTPQVSANLVSLLKEGKPEPDATLQPDESDVTVQAADTNTEDSQAAEDILVTLPGISPHSPFLPALKSAFPSLAELCKAPQSDLVKIMGRNGTQLYSFLHNVDWSEKATV